MRPQWLSTIYSSDTGQDFLNLRNVQENMVAELMPGVITITPRARYYAFYCWLLTEYVAGHPEEWSFNKFVQRREQIFGLANVAVQESPSGLAGSNKFNAHWRTYQEAEHVPLTADDYLKAGQRGYGQYAGVIRELGLAEEHDNGLYISKKGQRLSQAFAESIATTDYFQNRSQYDLSTHISSATVVEYGNACHLDNLASTSERIPIRDTLFSLNTASPSISEESENTLVNMRATLGILLEIAHQTGLPPRENAFRQHILYALCPDYEPYQPTDIFKPVLRQWQLYELRDLFTYSLFALWMFFLHWLHEVDGGTLADFRHHLGSLLGEFNEQNAESSLASFLDQKLDAVVEEQDTFQSQCQSFANRSQFEGNERQLFTTLASLKHATGSEYLQANWGLLANCFLRLSGLPQDKKFNYWLNYGGHERKSLHLFLRGMDERRQNGATVLDTLMWLTKEFVVAQHILASLSKWQQRKANTFHFQYETGYFSFVRFGRRDLSAPRIANAINMLQDLGMFAQQEDGKGITLSEFGHETLARVKQYSHE